MWQDAMRALSVDTTACERTNTVAILASALLQRFEGDVAQFVEAVILLGF